MSLAAFCHWPCSGLESATLQPGEAHRVGSASIRRSRYQRACWSRFFSMASAAKARKLGKTLSGGPTARARPKSAAASRAALLEVRLGAQAKRPERPGDDSRFDGPGARRQPASPQLRCRRSLAADATRAGRAGRPRDRPARPGSHVAVVAWLRRAFASPPRGRAPCRSALRPSARAGRSRRLPESPRPRDEPTRLRIPSGWSGRRG